MVFNQQGRMVRELMNGPLAMGRHSLTWNGSNHHQEPVASGLYFISLVKANSVNTLKVLLLK